MNQITVYYRSIEYVGMFCCIKCLHLKTARDFGTVMNDSVPTDYDVTVLQTSSAMLVNVPPISQTLSLNPSCINDLMLKPCVGMICDMSSSESY